MRKATYALAKELKVIGLMNVQFAIKDNQLYVLEVNPRASRTVPFVAKAIGVPLAKLAAKVMTGKKLKELGFTTRTDAEALVREGSGVPLRAFPRRRPSRSGPRCVRPAKSWASTTISAWLLPRRKAAANPACRSTATCSSP